MGTTGWRARFAADLDHYASKVTDALAWVPGWAVALLAAALLALVIRRALRTPAHAPEDGGTPAAEEGTGGSEAVASACCTGSETGAGTSPVHATAAPAATPSPNTTKEVATDGR
ncbi:cytochrome c biogenesis protein CcdA, partial [Streptomyces sp. NPDC052535]